MNTHFEVGAAPAALKALRKVFGVLGQFLNIDPKRARGIPGPQRVVDQLQIGAASFTETLRLNRFTAALWTVHFASEMKSKTLSFILFAV
jgi:hypothetical protein